MLFRSALKKEIREEVKETPEEAEEKKSALKAEIKKEIKEEAEKEEEEAEETDPLTEQEWEVTCPTCSKAVKTQPGSLYHRCPSCNNVFGLQKKNKDEEGEATEEGKDNA